MKILKAAAKLAGVLLAAAVALTPAVSHAQKGERYKVVFQVSDDDPGEVEPGAQQRAQRASTTSARTTSTSRSSPTGRGSTC